MQRRGWTLLFYDGAIEQLSRLSAAVQRARQSNPDGYDANASVKLFRAVTRWMFDEIPGDPARDDYSQGKTSGAARRLWR